MEKVNAHFLRSLYHHFKSCMYRSCGRNSDIKNCISVAKLMELFTKHDFLITLDERQEIIDLYSVSREEILLMVGLLYNSL